jgi:hypothetical protein
VKPWNGHLLLEEAAGDKGGDGGEQPLDAPKLDGLPIEHGASAEEQADGESAYDAQDTKQEGYYGRYVEAEPEAEAGEFRHAGDFTRNIQIGTASAAGMAIQ